MRTLNDTLISSTQTISATTYNSEPINVGHMMYFAIQLVYSGAAADVYLQASCDEGIVNSLDPSQTSITNWSTLSDTTMTISGSGSGIFDMTSSGYNWVRVVINGTATVTSLRINGKGV